MRSLVLVLTLLLSAPAWADRPAAARLADLDARVAAAPDDVELRLRRAALRLRAGMPVDALADLAEVPDGDLRKQLLRAEVHAVLGSDDLALADLDALLAGRPDHAAARDARAHLREPAGDFAGALADATAAHEAGPTVDRTLTRARLLVVVADRREDDAADVGAAHREAAGVCAASADALGGAAVLRLAAADHYAAGDRVDLALAQVDLLLEASPEHVPWLALRADLLDQAGDPDAARTVRRHALHHLEEQLAIRPTFARRALHDRLTQALQESP